MAGYRTYRHNRIVEYLLNKLPKECRVKETLLIDDKTAFNNLRPDI
jgi:hypothetical protein